MIFGSVCSGIEAASAAWGPIGWSAAFLSETAAFPRAVLRHHHPETPLHGDFTTIRSGQYGPIDLLVGGTPCQSFSVAGLRGGLDDDRGNLALEYLRLADRLRPRWLVWENVAGVLSSNGGRDFGAILGGMVELGYGFAYRVLDAQFFGVAQRRRRVFVVGHLGGWRRPAAVLLERQSLSGNPPPRRDPGEGFTHDLAPCIGASGRGFERGGDPRGQDPVVAVLGFANVSDGSAARNAEDLAPPLTLRHGDAGMVAFALRGRQGGAMPEVHDQISALRSASGGATRDFLTIPQHGIGLSSAVRRLTPIECERLQGFPDGYTAIPFRGKPAVDGPRYRALGNSMAVPVMAWIGRRIQMVDQS